MVEGEVTIATADGVRQRFVAGDVRFITQGTVTTRDVPAYLSNHHAAADVAC